MPDWDAARWRRQRSSREAGPGLAPIRCASQSDAPLCRTSALVGRRIWFAAWTGRDRALRPIPVGLGDSADLLGPAVGILDAAELDVEQPLADLHRHLSYG